MAQQTQRKTCLLLQFAHPSEPSYPNSYDHPLKSIQHYGWVSYSWWGKLAKTKLLCEDRNQTHMLQTKQTTNQSKKTQHPKPHHLQTALRVYSQLSWAGEFETTVFPSPSWWDNSCKKRNRSLAQQKLMINNGAKLWKHSYSPNDNILNIFKYELGTAVSCNSTVGRTSNFSTLEFQSSKQGKHCRAPVLRTESNEELWFQPDNRPDFDTSQHSSQSINSFPQQGTNVL